MKNTTLSSSSARKVVNKENKFVGDYDVCFIGYRLTTKEELEQSIKETKEGIEKRKKEKEDAVKTDI